MTLTEISAIRLFNQRIEKTEFVSPKEIVGWMGAMQAQDYTMAKWAVGLRVKDSTEVSIEKAYNKGDIIRTHLMRPTWHLVSADDIYWILDLTAPQIISQSKSRRKQLELTDAVLSKSKKIIEKVLAKEKCLTREEFSKEFNDANIATNENRLSHILEHAELHGLICSGPLKDKKQTYALLSDRIPIKKVLTRDESLAELAKRYFSSHGPATIADFAWWSGLSLKDARFALESVKTQFISEIIDSKEYWFSNSLTDIRIDNKSIYLLPAYDEFLISYKDRSASLGLIENKKIISDNGIFRPVIMVNGQVSGLWKYTRKNNSTLIEINFINPQNKSTIKKTEESARSFGRFSGKAMQIIFK